MNYKDKKNMIYQCNQAYELIKEGKYILALKILTDLLKEYPDDKITNYYIGLIFMCNQKYKEAIPYLKKGGNHIKTNVRLAVCYLCLNMELEAKDIYYNTLKEDKNFTLNFPIFNCYLKCKYENNKPNNYYSKQAYNYDKDSALNHIKERHYKTSIANCFNENIDIDVLFNQIESYIHKNPQNGYRFEFKTIGYYLFYYPNCGIKINPQEDTNDNVSCDYILVIVNAYTLDILTMYPTINKFNYKLCHLENEEDNHKQYIKVKNGLERFNSKYKNI